MYMRVHIHIYVHEYTRLALSVFIDHSPPFFFFLRQGVSPLTLKLRLPPPSQCWDYKGLPPHLAFCVGFWGLNSGPFVFMADTLLTEPFPQPLLYNLLYDTALRVFPHAEAGVVILTSWITLKMK